MTTWLLIFLTLSGLLFVLKMCYVAAVAGALPWTGGALYVSSSAVRIQAVLEAVPMTPGQVFCDLGCGDGRVLKAVNRSYGVLAIGYEVNLLAYFLARVRTFGAQCAAYNYFR